MDTIVLVGFFLFRLFEEEDDEECPFRLLSEPHISQRFLLDVLRKVHLEHVHATRDGLFWQVGSRCSGT